jgi:small subunit ribosomal protein S5
MDYRDRDRREPKEFQETVIHIARVARVVKGGRRFRFRALVAVGNGKTQVGVGIARGADVQTAVTKAVEVAKKQLVDLSLADTTIPHEVLTRVGGSEVLLKPAAPGTGVIAGGTVRAIVDLTGIRNILSKTHGSTNKVNVAYATMEALKSLVPREDWVTTRNRMPAQPQKPAPAKAKADAPAKIEEPKSQVSKPDKKPAKATAAKAKKS